VRLATFAFFTAVLAGLLLAPRPALAERVPFDITLVSDRGDPIQSISDAQQLLAHPSAPSILLDAQSYELRFADNADRRFGPFGKNNPFPRKHGFDSKNFALETSAWLAVPTAGDWTFGVASDDGFSMTVNGETFDHTGRRAAHSTLQTIDFPTAGDYPISVTYFQHLDRDELEVFDAPGTHTKMGKRQGFHLINANAFESLQVVDPPTEGEGVGDPPPTVGAGVPEPGALSLLGASMVMILLRRSRRIVLHR
jgi:PA14 domain